MHTAGQIMRQLLLRFCWLLEDVADKVTHQHADGFYPSRHFETPPTALDRHGQNRIGMKTNGRE